MQTDIGLIAAIPPLAALFWVCSGQPGAATYSLLRRRPGIVLFFAGVFWPNLPALLVLAADVGLPPRPLPILGYFLVALAAGRLQAGLIVGLYLAVLAYDVASTISGMFSLAVSELAAAVNFAGELNLFAAPLYVGMGCAVLGSSLPALSLMIRRREALARARLSFVTLMLIGLIIGESAFALTNNYALEWLPGRRAEVVAATTVSGFQEAVKRPAAAGNALLVVVEAWGVFRDPAHQQLIEAAFARDDLRARYRVTSGTVPYFGSTTAGEMRELCHSRAHYRTRMASASADCLPASLARRGFRTTALHAYSSRFFEREDWYPRIGFAHSIFGELLVPEFGRVCGGVFLGACDADIGKTLLPRLLLDRERRQFVYWLTLNTHVPIRPDQARDRFACPDSQENPFGRIDVCEMAEIWLETFETVVELAVAHAGKPLEILLVGDHRPPFWSRKAAALFRPGEVSWVRIAPR